MTLTFGQVRQKGSKVGRLTAALHILIADNDFAPGSRAWGKTLCGLEGSILGAVPFTIKEFATLTNIDGSCGSCRKHLEKLKTDWSRVG